MLKFKTFTFLLALLSSSASFSSETYEEQAKKFGFKPQPATVPAGPRVQDSSSTMSEFDDWLKSPSRSNSPSQKESSSYTLFNVWQGIQHWFHEWIY